MGRNPFMISLVVMLCLLSGCSGDDVDGCYSVEIAPGKFVPVKFSKWYPRQLTVQYSNTIVKYEGYLELNQPQTLMEFEGRLYLLALDAERKKGRDKWRYVCFRQEGNAFKEIPDSQFPRSIALLNLWRPGDRSRYSTGMGGVKLDEVKLIRELNPEDKFFVNSYQARLWFMLEVTNSLHLAERQFDTGEAGKKFLGEYIAKYKPVRMTSMEMKPLPNRECKF